MPRRPSSLSLSRAATNSCRNRCCQMIESDIAFVERLPTLRRLRPNPLPILGTAPKASTSDHTQVLFTANVSADGADIIQQDSALPKRRSFSSLLRSSTTRSMTESAKGNPAGICVALADLNSPPGREILVPDGTPPEGARPMHSAGRPRVTRELRELGLGPENFSQLRSRSSLLTSATTRKVVVRSRPVLRVAATVKLRARASCLRLSHCV